MEVCFAAQSYDLEDGFQDEDACEHVIGDFLDGCDNWRGVIPINAKNHSVDDDADHDGDFKGVTQADCSEQFSDLALI